MKLTNKVGLSLALAVMVIPRANADVWEDATVGLMPAVMNYTAHEPEGDTDAKTTVLPLSVSTTFNVNRITRLIADFRYFDFSYSADNGGIGLSVKGYQLALQVQREFRLSRDFRPWLGGGFASSMLDMQSRYRTDSDGYLIERLDDRSATNISGLVSAGLDYDLNRNWALASEVRYEMPFSDGLQGYGIAAGFRYSF